MPVRPPKLQRSSFERVAGEVRCLRKMMAQPFAKTLNCVSAMPGYAKLAGRQGIGLVRLRVGGAGGRGLRLRLGVGRRLAHLRYVDAGLRLGDGAVIHLHLQRLFLDEDALDSFAAPGTSSRRLTLLDSDRTVTGTSADA